MNAIDLNQILEQVCMEEYTLPDTAVVHHFSLKHRRNMKRILALPYSAPKLEIKLKLNRRTVCIMIAAVFLAAVSVTGSAYLSGVFRKIEHSDNTEFFAKDIDSAPSEIKQVYYLTEIPKGYIEAERNSNWYQEEAVYYFGDDKYNIIVFTQTVKEQYNQHFNTEGYFFEEVSVGEFKGLYIDWGDDNIILGDVVWDNGDYVFEITGNLSKDELLDLANSAKVL